MIDTTDTYMHVLELGLTVGATGATLEPDGALSPCNIPGFICSVSRLTSNSFSAAVFAAVNLLGNYSLFCHSNDHFQCFAENFSRIITEVGMWVQYRTIKMHEQTVSVINHWSHITRPWFDSFSCQVTTFSNCLILSSEVLSNQVFFSFHCMYRGC